MKIQPLDQSSAIKMEKLRGPYNTEFLEGDNGLKSMQPTLFWKVLFVGSNGSPLFDGAWRDGVFVDSVTVPTESVQIGAIESNPLVPKVALSDGRGTPYSFRVGFYVDIYGSIEKNIYKWLKTATCLGVTHVKKCTVDVYGYPMGGINKQSTIDPYIQYRFYNVFPTSVDEYTYDHKNQKWANVRKVSFVFTDYDIFVDEVKYKQDTNKLHYEATSSIRNSLDNDSSPQKKILLDTSTSLFGHLKRVDPTKPAGAGTDNRGYFETDRGYPKDRYANVNNFEDSFADYNTIGDPRFGLKIVHDKYFGGTGAGSDSLTTGVDDDKIGHMHSIFQKSDEPLFVETNKHGRITVGHVIKIADFDSKLARKDSTMKYPRSGTAGFEESAMPGRQSPITTFIQTAVNAYITPDTPHYHGNMKVISKVIRKVQQWFYEEPKHKDVPVNDRIERHLASWKTGTVGVAEDDHLRISDHGPIDTVLVDMQDNAQIGTHTNGPQVKVYDYDMISMHKKTPGLDVDPNDHTDLTGHVPANGVVVDKNDMTANETHQDPNNVGVDPNDHTSNTTHQDQNNVGVDPNDHTSHTAHESVNIVGVDEGDHTNTGNHTDVKEIYSPEPDHLVSDGAIDVAWVNTEINDQVDATVIKIKRVVVGQDEVSSEDISISSVEPMETNGETSKSVLYNGNRPQKLDAVGGAEVTNVVDTPDTSNIETSIKIIKRNEPLSHEDKGKKVNPDVGTVDVDKLKVQSVQVRSEDRLTSDLALTDENSPNLNRVSSKVHSIVDHKNDNFTKVEHDKEKLDLTGLNVDTVSTNNRSVDPPSHVGAQKIVNPEDSFIDFARRIAEGKMVDVERQGHFTFKVDKIVSVDNGSVNVRKISADMIDVNKNENAIRGKRESGKIVDVHAKDNTEIWK